MEYPQKDLTDNQINIIGQNNYHLSSEDCRQMFSLPKDQSISRLKELNYGDLICVSKSVSRFGANVNYEYIYTDYVITIHNSEFEESLIVSLSEIEQDKNIFEYIEYIRNLDSDEILYVTDKYKSEIASQLL